MGVSRTSGRDWSPQRTKFYITFCLRVDIFLPKGSVLFLCNRGKFSLSAFFKYKVACHNIADQVVPEMTWRKSK